MFDHIQSYIIEGTTFSSLRINDGSGHTVMYDFVFCDDTDARDFEGEVFWARVSTWDNAETYHATTEHTC